MPHARPKARWRSPAIVAATVAGVVAVAALIVLRPRTIRVEGQSMAPTLRDDDRLVSLRILSPLVRGDIVCMRYPLNTSKSFVYRIVGLPGESLSIADGVVRIGGRPLAEPYLVDANRSHEDFGPRQLGADEYFLMGDRRNNASDSREWGPVARPLIWCRVRSVWWRSAERSP